MTARDRCNATARLPVWLRLDRLAAYLLMRGRSWPAGYVRYRLRGHGRSLGIFSHMTLAERVFLYTTALRLPRGSAYAEIGSYLGASACCLAAAASERQGTLYCVDTWQNDAMTEGKRDTWSEFENNVRAYRKYVHPVRAQSVHAAALVPGKLDLLFVDGDHSIEGVKADLEAWLPKLRDGAWLVMHDYGWAEGVQRAVGGVVRALELGPPVILPNLYAARIRSGVNRQQKLDVAASVLNDRQAPIT